MVFSTNVPDAILGDHQVYVTLVMRYYSSEDDEPHTDFIRTMKFTLEGAIPNEPKTLVNVFLDRRSSTEDLPYDSRDSALQAMSDALRSDMSGALTELSSHTTRWGLDPADICRIQIRIEKSLHLQQARCERRVVPLHLVVISAA